jgi:hypothetical protein
VLPFYTFHQDITTHIQTFKHPNVIRLIPAFEHKIMKITQHITVCTHVDRWDVHLKKLQCWAVVTVLMESTRSGSRQIIRRLHPEIPNQDIWFLPFSRRGASPSTQPHLQTSEMPSNEFDRESTNQSPAHEFIEVKEHPSTKIHSSNAAD